MEEHDSGEVTALFHRRRRGRSAWFTSSIANVIRPIDATGLQVFGCMSQWGIGSCELLSNG
jgi:hypothetical protein